MQQANGSGLTGLHKLQNMKLEKHAYTKEVQNGKRTLPLRACDGQVREAAERALDLTACVVCHFPEEQGSCDTA